MSLPLPHTLCAPPLLLLYVQAFMMYFDAKFIPPAEEGNPIILSTSPDAPPTHWGQTLLFLTEPLPLRIGEWLRGHLSCHKSPDDQRALQVEMEFAGNGFVQKKTQKWSLSRE